MVDKWDKVLGYIAVVTVSWEMEEPKELIYMLNTKNIPFLLSSVIPASEFQYVNEKPVELFALPLMSFSLSSHCAAT